MQITNYFDKQKSCRIINGTLAIIPPKFFKDVPIIRKQGVDLNNLEYVGFHNTKKYDNPDARKRTVGFFMQDIKFECVTRKPWRYVNRLSQYKQTMTPDISCYTDMSSQDQWCSTFVNRLVGAYWQNQGLLVIPTITWSNERSYAFAFSGVDKGSVVAVSTIGTKKNYALFMSGFKEMCSRIKPEAVVCYCTPYREMHNYAIIIPIEYEGKRPWREAKYRPDPNQLSLFDYDYIKEVV